MTAANRSEQIRHLVVLGHPSPDSLNRAIAETYCSAVRENGQAAVLCDLYADGFDPVLKDSERPGVPGYAQPPSVARYVKLLENCDVVVFVYPIWFGGPPAIVKGFVDRVLGAGFRPEFIARGEGHKLLQGTKLVTFSTSATRLPWLEEQGQWSGLRQCFEHYLTTIFHMREAERHHFDAIGEKLEQRVALEYLSDVRQAARAVAAELSAERHRIAARSAIARWSNVLGHDGDGDPTSS